MPNRLINASNVSPGRVERRAILGAMLSVNYCLAGLESTVCQSWRTLAGLQAKLFIFDIQPIVGRVVEDQRLPA